MYTLVNKYGNRVVETESAVKKDRLLKEGFRLVEEVEEIAAPAAVSEPKTPKSNKGKGASKTAKKTPTKE